MIIINKNKKYIRIVLIIILMLWLIYFSIFKVLRNPSKYIYFLMPTKNSVIIFYITGILVALLVLYMLLKDIYRKNAVIQIDEEGIFNGFFPYRKKFLKWEEINDIRVIRYNHNNYIAIFLKKYNNEEKGIDKIFYHLNKFTMGTPYIIYWRNFDISFKELQDYIFNSWEEYNINLTKK